jgi:nicotinate-nucleotide pyrophosphorylase (carboxylating)
MPAKILDTRKTTPGWRLLEKYAVRCGGGWNHRLGLSDGILIKDNHLAALAREMDVAAAVAKAKTNVAGAVLIEVEVESNQDLEAALTAKPDMVLLDNMIPQDLRQAVAIRNTLSPSTLLEASGGITLENVRAIAETGVDRISIGALTHSASALDIALDYFSP